MIAKEKLIEYLKESIDSEEKSIPIYMQHLDSAVFWLGLGNKIAEDIKNSFTDLANQSKRHKVILQGLMKNIIEDKRDAF